MIRSRSRVVALIAFSLLVLHCKKRPTELEKLGVTEREAQQILREIAAARSATPAQAPITSPKRRVVPDAAAPVPVQPPIPEPALENDNWIIDELVDVAPAGPSRAHASGVWLVTDQNRLLDAKLGPLPKGKTSTSAEKTGSPSAPSPVTPLPDDVGTFKLARGPCFSKTHAYWVASHFLYRRALDKPDAPLETLTDDARVATRCSAVTLTTPTGERDWVAYVALPTEAGGPLLAKLWHGPKQALTLTPDASSALSVQLVKIKDRVFVYSVEGRTGMTSVHAREVELKGSAPHALDDHVVWVGGGAVPTTELVIALGPTSENYGLLPIEQDSSHFGMAIIQLSGLAPGAPSPNTWALYHNGMEHAPTDSAMVCDALTVLFARPSTATPRSPQELVLAELSKGALITEHVLSRSKAFFDVSIAPIKGGALISYVADYRTWARTLRCAQ